MKDAIMMDTVGLGAGVVDAFGIAVFQGLNQALYTFIPNAIGADQYELAGVYRQRARFTILLACAALTPFYIFSGTIIKSCG